MLKNDDSCQPDLMGQENDHDLLAPWATKIERNASQVTMLLQEKESVRDRHLAIQTEKLVSIRVDQTYSYHDCLTAVSAFFF